MPTLEENIQIAKEVVDEIKATTTSSNDIIKKELLPLLIPSMFRLLKAKFGEDKFNRYLEQQEKISKIRNISTQTAQEIGYSSPLMIGKVATAMHGVAECHELSAYTALKLIERKQPCVVIGYWGKQNPHRHVASQFNHAIVLMGDVKITALDPLIHFKYQPKNVVVVDTYLGYVGSARDYVRDNQSYIDKFGFDKSMGECSQLRQQDFAYAATMMAQAAKVSEKFLEKGIERYQRHPEDEVTKLIEEPSEISAPCKISTYPSLLFHLGNSQEQTKAYQAKVYSKVKDDQSNKPVALLASEQTLSATHFFKQPLPSYMFADDEAHSFAPQSY